MNALSPNLVKEVDVGLSIPWLVEKPQPLTFHLIQRYYCFVSNLICRFFLFYFILEFLPSFAREVKTILQFYCLFFSIFLVLFHISFADIMRTYPKQVLRLFLYLFSLVLRLAPFLHHSVQ